MRVDPAAWPFIGGALAAALLGVAVGGARLAVLPVALAGFFLYFFRDPERIPPAASSDAVLSPADGRVMVAGHAETSSAPPGTWQQISIFLSPIDVHVNRVPVSGVVTRVEYISGKFLPAYRGEAASENERSEIWIEHEGRTVVFRQVVGVLARRVVCRLSPGQSVRAGERFGIMKFGSRMDVFVPTTASLRVEVGQSVRGGETILATL
jgi:phosphatidylserine decarboxylase